MCQCTEGRISSVHSGDIMTCVGDIFSALGVCPRGGHFDFICTGVCGHRIGKLTHPQTEAGPKTDPFSDYLQ